METKRTSYIILGLVVAIYLVINLALPRIGHGFVTTYVIQPIIWGLVIFFILRLPRPHPAGKWRMRQDLLKLALMLGVFQVACLLIGGLFSGFGKSPYSFSPQGIFLNLLFVGSALVGMELSRAYIINSLSRRHTVLVLGLVSLLFMVLSFPLARFMGLREPLQIVTFLGGDAIPLFAQSLLASFMAFLGGPLPAIAYLGILQAFEWFSPVLPDLSWGLKSLLGTIVPALGFFAVHSLSSGQLRIVRRERRAKGEGSLASWTVGGIAVLVFLWFSLGFFPFYPAAVAGGSMSPTLHLGDMVIVTKVAPETIKENDIIEFQMGDASVIHRVIKIDDDNGYRQFITQGDANDSLDIAPVSAEQLQGKVMFAVPKIGWVTLIMRSV